MSESPSIDAAVAAAGEQPAEAAADVQIVGEAAPSDPAADTEQDAEDGLD